MAEQKTEDTKPPVARRGARPFVGPAGAAPAATTARPLARPAAPPARPGRAPFSPLSPDRTALGVPRQTPAAPVTQAAVRPELAAPSAPVHETETIDAVQPEQAVVPAAEWPVEAVAAPEPTPAFGITVSSLTPAVHAAYAPPEQLIVEPTIDAAVPSAIAEPDAMDFGFAATSPEAEASLEDAFGVGDAPTTPRRPVTSEMIAIDAFAAFDSVWGPGNTPVASPTIEAAPAPDLESLGAAHAEPMWADEITAMPVQGESAAEQTPDADTGESTWSKAATPNSAFPAWLMDDVHEAPAADAVAASAASEPTYSEAAHAEAWHESVIEADTVEPVIGEQGEPMILESSVMPPAAPQSDAHHAHRLRMSGALDRLAERIRGGEIDVSSVAPEAPDAAVLASVLAALLGGSSSR